MTKKTLNQEPEENSEQKQINQFFGDISKGPLTRQEKLEITQNPMIYKILKWVEENKTNFSSIVDVESPHKTIVNATVIESEALLISRLYEKLNQYKEGNYD